VFGTDPSSLYPSPSPHQGFLLRAWGASALGRSALERGVCERARVCVRVCLCACVRACVLGVFKPEAYRCQLCIEIRQVGLSLALP
jgi:hypothetical protein